MSSANIIIAALVSTLIVVIFGMTTLCASDVHKSGKAIWQRNKKQVENPTPRAAPEIDFGDLKIVQAEPFAKDLQALQVDSSATLVVYAPHCPWCVKMVETMKAVHKNKDLVGDEVNMLEASQDLQKAEGPVKELLQFVKGLPTIFKIYKINANELKVSFFSGFCTKEDYLKKINSSTSINLKLA